MKVPIYVKQFNLHLDENNIVRCRHRNSRTRDLATSRDRGQQCKLKLVKDHM